MIRGLIITVLLLVMAWGTACGTGAPQTRQAFRTIVPGVEYLHEVVADGPLSIHIVKIELSRKDLAIATTLANGTVLGRQSVSDQIASLPKALGRPIAAINANFFETGQKGAPRYAGTLEGLCIRGGELVHGPAGHAFWINADGKPHLNTSIRPHFQLVRPDGTKMPFSINCATTAHKSEVGASDVVLFTPSFGISTQTESGLELVLIPADKNEWLPLRINRSFTAIVHSVSRDGDTRIDSGTMVLAIAAKQAENLPPVKPGDYIALTTETEPPLSDAAEAIAGGPVLLLGGKKSVAATDSENRAPRTAVGFNATHLFMVVVDGRQPKVSIGMSHHELAELMARVGCTDAINLDGGGSSTLWLDGSVINSPSDAAGERAVGNALVVVKRADK